MSDRLLVGTSRESAVMKAGKFRFRKGKEKRVGNAGWKDNSLTWGILLLPIYRIRKKGTLRQCVVRVGEVLFASESSADKGLSFQSWQSPKKKITVEKTGKTIRGCRDKHQGTYLNGMAHGKFR